MLSFYVILDKCHPFRQLKVVEITEYTQTRWRCLSDVVTVLGPIPIMDEKPGARGLLVG
jgi:hypothetical protein